MTHSEWVILAWLQGCGEGYVLSSVARMNLEADGLIRWVPAALSDGICPGTMKFAITEKGLKALDNNPSVP